MQLVYNEAKPFTFFYTFYSMLVSIFVLCLRLHCHLFLYFDDYYKKIFLVISFIQIHFHVYFLFNVLFMFYTFIEFHTISYIYILHQLELLYFHDYYKKIFLVISFIQIFVHGYFLSYVLFILSI